MRVTRLGGIVGDAACAEILHVVVAVANAETKTYTITLQGGKK